ncbi:MAG: hypothetical protein Q8N77_03050 [Nanoarchaeota archaeon]|nr:hypothetical protein [Nanoarchaeota archaeon]
MKRVILDTNFLLAISQFHIDVFSELKRICNFPFTVCILDKTVDELNSIVSTPGKKDKAAARLVLEIIKGRADIISAGDGYADDLLVRLADKDTVIATQDRELKKRINTLIITIKQKKYLIFENA